MKNPKQQRRSQITVAIIIMVALIGILVINTDHVSAVKNTDQTKAVAEQNGASGADARINSFGASTAPSLIKIASALVIVIACIYLGIYMLKRMMGKKYAGNRGYNLLEVLETTYIAPKKSVTLLRVADKSVLVGMSENQITLLTELDKDQTKEVLAMAEKETPAENFGGVLKTATQKIREMGLRKSVKAALES